MKNSFLSIVFLIIFATLSGNVRAQHPIPSYNIFVVSTPTTFEEVPQKRASYITTNRTLLSKTFKNASKGRKEIQVGIRPQGGGNNAWAKIEIYSVNGLVVDGPYNVDDSQVFRLSLDDQYLWGVRVLEVSDSAIFDVWY